MELNLFDSAIQSNLYYRSLVDNNIILLQLYYDLYSACLKHLQAHLKPIKPIRDIN